MAGLCYCALNDAGSICFLDKKAFWEYNYSDKL